MQDVRNAVSRGSGSSSLWSQDAVPESLRNKKEKKYQAETAIEGNSPGMC